MLQKELAKRLKARYDTKMDGNGWLEVSSDGIPLCRIKYNGQFLSNVDKTLSDEYRSKNADIQDEISTVREYVGLYEHAPQKLFFKWGIEFDDEHPYIVPDMGNREVKYADKKEIQDGILEKYPPQWKEETPAPSSLDGSGQAQHDSPKNEPQRTPPKGEKRGGKPIRTSPPKKETAPDITEAEIMKDLTETEVQSNEPS